MANVLVLGSGAREHAIASKLAESSKVGHVYVCRGNAGMVQQGSSSTTSSISIVCEYSFNSYLNA
jgi:phosphoribosylamine-glycine ligase